MKTRKDKINSDLNKQIGVLKKRLEVLVRKSRKLSLYRLVTFLLGIILFFGFYFYNYKVAALNTAIIFFALFIFLMIIHNKVEKSINRYKTYIKIKEEQLARSELNWDGIPYNEHIISDVPNSTEQDLNITEKNGILHLISIGVSIESVNILRVWLSNKSEGFNEIISRQNVIKELLSLNHFRDRLQLTSKLSFQNIIKKVELIEWVEKSANKKGLKLYTIFLIVLCLINLIFFVGYLAGLFQIFHYHVLLFYIFFYYVGARYIKDIQLVSEFLYEEVRRYSKVFTFIENYNYGKNEAVKKIIHSFLNKKSSPSKTLSKINFTIEVLNLRANPFIWFFLMLILPIDFLLSLRVEKFRNTIRTDSPKWFNDLYNLEAYCSLAEFAHLNPDYSFPEYLESSKILDCQSMGHPLINYSENILNDFQITEKNKTNIITGSNMSGKSTFLRTVGINVLLANAGSVVNAQKLVMSNFDLYTCIKVSDSIVDGISYFYAEVKRLKNILEQIKTSDKFSLVLIDEIYKGTNNIERVVGSKALIKHLYEQNIYNIISTHDLELSRITDEVLDAKNFHFKEIIEKNKMSFNYKLTEGPCPTTNALQIMKLEGLPT